jgi:hypothetical protein
LFTPVYNAEVNRSDGRSYDGIRYEELKFASVSWPAEVVEHMATRSRRYGRPQFDITDAQWASDAVADPFRLVGDGRSRDGDTVRVIGWSSQVPGRGQLLRGRLLKVWLVADEHASNGRWIGRTACEASSTEHRAYEADLAAQDDTDRGRY